MWAQAAAACTSFLLPLHSFGAGTAPSLGQRLHGETRPPATNSSHRCEWMLGYLTEHSVRVGHLTAQLLQQGPSPLAPRGSLLLYHCCWPHPTQQNCNQRARLNKFGPDCPQLCPPSKDFTQDTNMNKISSPSGHAD